MLSTQIFHLADRPLSTHAIRIEMKWKLWKQIVTDACIYLVARSRSDGDRQLLKFNDYFSRLDIILIGRIRWG